MFVYVLAPLVLMIAFVIGWGVNRIPVRGYTWLIAATLALSIIEYFSGVFPAITWPFGLWMLLFAAILYTVRRVMEHSVPKLLRSRLFVIIGVIILAVILLSLFNIGGLFTLAVIMVPIWQSWRRRGPRAVPQGGMDALQRALQTLGPLTILAIGTVVGLIATSILASIVTSFAAAVTYGPQVNLVHAKVTSTLPIIETSDVPVVERDSAMIVLSNSIGSLGTQYHVSQRGLSLVRYQGQLIWTAPLDYNNGLIWLTRRTSPGYVWTSAANPSAKPVVIQNESYLITPEAGFSYNLDRVLYQQFPTRVIGTSDWEIDPSGHGWWVTSLYEPAPGLAGLVTRVITGSALTDPTTGQITYYPLGAQPAWVSQIVGPNFAQSEAARYGWDRAGFIASSLTHQLATQPLHDLPYNVLLGDGALAWEIPLTSPNAGDNSLSGMILVNAETNAVTYTAFTGLQNDLSISQRIDGSTLNSTLSSGRALLYNIGGTLGYIAPVVNQSGIVQQVAIVDPKNVAQPIIASNLSDALAAWQSYLLSSGTGNPNAPSLVVTVTGNVQRVATLLESGGGSGSAVKEYWLFLIGGHAYRAALSLAPDIVPFVQPGDRVTVTYVRGSGAPIPIDSLADHTLH